jgi:hypothetical protein
MGLDDELILFLLDPIFSMRFSITRGLTTTHLSRHNRTYHTDCFHRQAPSNYHVMPLTQENATDLHSLGRFPYPSLRRSVKNMSIYQYTKFLFSFITSLQSNSCTALTTQNTTKITVLSNTHKTGLQFGPKYL